MSERLQPDPRKVFVVHGRNTEARDDLFDFLSALNLSPLEWDQALQLTGQGSPYVGEILDRAFEVAQAIVVLFTPDEITYVRSEYSEESDPEREPAAQARPNVLFEAGMAMGRNPSRTIFVELGTLRPFSDIAGRHTIRMNGTAEKRQALASRLEAAGCSVDRTGSRWLSAGTFLAPPDPGGGQPLGRRVPDLRSPGISLSARYQGSSGGHGKLVIRNHSREEISDLNVEFPDDVQHSIVGLPLPRLPAGESASFPLYASLGSGPSKFFVQLVARDREGVEIRQEQFVDMY